MKNKQFKKMNLNKVTLSNLNDEMKDVRGGVIITETYITTEPYTADPEVCKSYVTCLTRINCGSGGSGTTATASAVRQCNRD